MNHQAATQASWDDWHKETLAAGVSAELANMGREVMRTHRQNRWSKDFLGAPDDAPIMLAICLEDPAQAELLFTENLYPYDSQLIDSTRRRLGLA